MKSPEGFNGPIPNVEAEANYEGNETILLLDRLNNPTIKRQIVELLHKAEEAYIDNLQNNTEPLIENGIEDERWVKAKVVKPNSQYLFSKSELNRSVASPEEIEQNLDKRVQEISQGTHIEYSSEMPSVHGIPINFREQPDKKMTTKQMSIIEAHEKGHYVRPYGEYDDFFRDYFSKGFDFSKIKYDTEKDFMHSRTQENSDESPQNIEDRKKDVVDYLLRGEEIAERMSQLKNYFGMKGDEQFTKEHLAYAREHYVTDTQSDNGMTWFFEAITPETEDVFIELINSSGI